MVKFTSKVAIIRSTITWARKVPPDASLRVHVKSNSLRTVSECLIISISTLKLQLSAES